MTIEESKAKREGFIADMSAQYKTYYDAIDRKAAEYVKKEKEETAKETALQTENEGREYIGPFSGIKNDSQGNGDSQGDANTQSGFGKNTYAKGSYYTGGSVEGKNSRESLLSKSGKFITDIPQWGYKDFINERVNWVKGLNSLTDGPAWFYFKIFFKFNTAFGLLGGVLDNDYEKTTDTAIKYILMLERSSRHKSLHMDERYGYLRKFVKTLSYISCNAPWFFSKVNDVNAGLTTDFNNLTKEKSITIECLEESIDMKLTTMMDLYKFAAYDDVNQLEILPENLRKFDMDILVFQTPIRYIHTSMMDLEQNAVKYKDTIGNGQQVTDIMSYKLFSFKNCEFDYNALNSMLPQSFTNDNPFKSIPQIKINYERVYQHTYNEFAGLMFGSSGVFNSYRTSNYEIVNGELNIVASDSNKRGRMLNYMHEHPNYYNPNSTVWKALVDASEENLSAAMRMIDDNTAFGNLYWSSDTNPFKAAGATIKNTVKNVGNNYKNMAKSLVGSWGVNTSKW